MRATVTRGATLRRRSALVVLLVLLVFGGTPLVPLGPVQAQESLDPSDADGDGIPDAAPGDGLRQVGTLPSPQCAIGIATEGPCAMVVDPGRRLGFASGSLRGENNLVMYDLERLGTNSVIEKYSDSVVGRAGNVFMERAVLAPARELILLPGGYPWALDEMTRGDVAKCPVGSSRSVMGAWTYHEQGGRPHLAPTARPIVPCSGSQPFYWLRGTYHAESDSYYASGVAEMESWRGANSPKTNEYVEDDGQTLLVRQMRLASADRFTLDWEVDLRLAGCGRRYRTPGNVLTAFAARAENAVYAYCWDQHPTAWAPFGFQGYLVRIPLVKDPTTGVMRPETVDSGPPRFDPALGTMVNFRSRRIVALPGNSVRPFVDPVSERILLATTDTINGNAVWVLDPKPGAERFVGVITGGNVAQPAGNAAVGFDPVSGRAYVLTQDGVLIAPVRADPVPSGVVYPVLRNAHAEEYFGGRGTLAVVPMGDGTTRIIAGTRVPGKTGEFSFEFQVLADTIPEPPDPIVSDPDAYTTQVDESPGTTASVVSGAGLAAGAHVIQVGGVPQAVNQVDPACFLDLDGNPDTKGAGERIEAEPEVLEATTGRRACAADVIAATGTRDAWLASTKVEAGSASGAVASGTRLENTDNATDADLKRVGGCGEDVLVDFSSGPRSGSMTTDTGPPPTTTTTTTGPRDVFLDRYAASCGEAHARLSEAAGPDLRKGTQGRSGEGFPFRAATCGDFGGNPSTRSEPPDEPPGMRAAGQSAVTCDAAAPSAEARSTAVGPLVVSPEVSRFMHVGGISSRVVTVRIPAGQVTVAQAVATDVVIGPLTIAEVRSTATTTARGRTRTTDARLDRVWCGVHLDGEEVQPGCRDAESEEVERLLTDVNGALLQRVQLSVPTASKQATPGGYQAVVTKHEGQRASDQVMNDDSSRTVPALQVVAYNDGSKGRSRIVVQLAGVHAESRYGITLLPKFSSPQGFDGFGGGTPGAPGTPGTPGTTRFLPGSVPEASAVVEGKVFEYIIEGGGLAGIRDELPTDPIRRFLRWLPDAVKDLLRLFIQHPVEFALLFLVFSLLGAPAYMAYRRRTFVGVVAG